MLLLSAALFAQTTHVEGTVQKADGTPLSGATVRLQTGPTVSTVETGENGKFVFEAAGTSGSITVQAPGYAPAALDWSAGNLPLKIVLSSLSERLVVTATRVATRIDEAPGSSVLLSEQDLQATPALTIDDTLKQIPGFTLFRRTGSRFANPTSQGVSLRGIGASGASRALVLVDGVPANDPFGGWVYWSRIPEEALGSAEVVRGGASSLYGSGAMGGVVQLLERRPEAPALSLETSFGNEKTPDFSFWTGARYAGWDGALAADLYRSDGYILVPESQRGPVDTPANADHQFVEATLGRQITESTRVFARGSYFTESRHNGTIIQKNSTENGQAVMGADSHLGTAGDLSLRFFGTAQSYVQTFSSVTSVNSQRDTDSLTNLQHVPSQVIGGSAQWSRTLGKYQTLVAGLDSQQVQGASLENIFSSGTQTRFANSGGHQRTWGVYGEDIIRLGAKWIATVGLRYDHWSNFSARSISIKLTPPVSTTITPFADRRQDALNPRVSLLYQATNHVSFTASGYRAFRAPTLNELYRSFRVGNVVTQGNDALKAERLTGGEGGVSVKALDSKLNLRGNFFWAEITNPIANVTLSTTPPPIQRQRQNLGRTRSRGLELDGTYRWSGHLEFSGGYQYVDATVLHFVTDTNNPSIVGNDLPQIPRHQFTLQGRYWNPSKLMLAVQGRLSSSQFDDDQNLLKLDRFFVVDLMAARDLGHGVQIFGAIENLFNQRYNVGLTPTATQGPPILGRVGIRFNYRAH